MKKILLSIAIIIVALIVALFIYSAITNSILKRCENTSPLPGRAMMQCNWFWQQTRPLV
ncbi:MAG: hypothetical protein WCV80_02060 [Candidatus Paceibacterota bacterium]|jgi:hypothetical protein